MDESVARNQRCENGNFVAGTVVVDDDWSIVGWGGILFCAHCGNELSNPELDQLGAL